MGQSPEEQLATLRAWVELLLDGHEVTPVLLNGRLVGLQLRLASDQVHHADDQQQLDDEQDPVIDGQG